MKTCKACKLKFAPFNTMAKVCSPACALKIAKEKNDKQRKLTYNRETRRRKEAAKTRTDHLREAQQIFNKYIRTRDSGRPCISCDRPDNGRHQRHASHFRPTGNCTQLRFHEMNVAASCMQCNSWKSGNLTPYRAKLVQLYGEDIVLWLEAQNSPYTWAVDDLLEIKTLYREKLKELIAIYQ